jgi:hypothetical protein
MFLKPCQALGFSCCLLFVGVALFGALLFISRACDYDLSFKTLSSARLFSAFPSTALARCASAVLSVQRSPRL